MQQEMKDRIKTAIQRTYSVIAGDLQEARWQCGETGDIPLDEAAECCIDADRVDTYGGDKEASEALYAMDDYESMMKLGQEALKGYA